MTANRDFQIGMVTIGNVIQNFITLHYTRRVYNGRFVPNPSLGKGVTSNGKNPEDDRNKLVPVSSSGKDVDGKAQDQVTPLAARLFGTYTFAVGIIRLYGAHNITNPAFYQLLMWSHVIAICHFMSEIFVYKSVIVSGAPQFMPLSQAFGGFLWLALQYNHYVEN